MSVLGYHRCEYILWKAKKKGGIF